MTVHFLDAPKQSLQHAILVYGGSKSATLTIHPVIHHEQGARIAAGRPATRKELRKLLDATAPKGKSTKQKDPEFLPVTVLATGDDFIVWWCPPQNRAIWFRSDDAVLGQRQGFAPHPGLIFVVMPKAQIWNVFAVKGADRPKPDTILHQAPYFNVWEGGGICVGNVEIPKSALPSDINAWETAFFRSEFTHPNIHKKGCLVKGRESPHAIWKALLDGKYRRFPATVLVPTRHTVADLLRSIVHTSKRNLSL